MLQCTASNVENQPSMRCTVRLKACPWPPASRIQRLEGCTTYRTGTGCMAKTEAPVAHPGRKRLALDRYSDWTTPDNTKARAKESLARCGVSPLLAIQREAGWQPPNHSQPPQAAPSTQASIMSSAFCAGDQDEILEKKAKHSYNTTRWAVSKPASNHHLGGFSRLHDDRFRQGLLLQTALFNVAESFSTRPSDSQSSPSPRSLPVARRAVAFKAV